MRIESIEIKNFRQYRDEKICFPKKSGKRDVHVIIGENGEGKTNILNALTWCLYGEELHLGDRNTAIRLINSQYVDELRRKGEKKGEVTVIVEMSLDEENSSMKFLRTATFSITAADAVLTSHNVMAIKNKGARGTEFIENKEDVEMWISRYAPRAINEYIFFDGEQMDQYFKESQRENIESGIKDLTQATTIEKTIKGINSYNNNEITPMLRKYGDSKVQEAQDHLGECVQRYQHQEETVHNIDVDIKKHDAAIRDLNDKIKGHDNVKKKVEELEELEEKIGRLEKALTAANEDLIKFTREYYTYFALYPALKKFYDYIMKQEKAGTLPPKIDKDLVNAIVKNHKCSVCGCDLDAEHVQHVLSILHKLEVSSSTSAELNRASSALVAMFEKMKSYPAARNTKRNQCIQASKDLDEAHKKYTELNGYLKTIPNTEEISHAIEQRDIHIQHRDAAQQRLGREKYLLGQAKNAVDEATKELEKAVQSNNNMGIYKKQMDFCRDCIRILTETKEEILNECREEMQKETFEIFNRLIWKKDTFTKVNILEDYSFELLDRYGEQTLGSCSAAERALLALSFTIALQKTSGHDSLLYIDTPLGRVGEKNRANFTQVLLDVAEAKQVILSFTPTEYDANVRAELEGNYSSYSELHFNDGTTTIKQ